MTSTALQKTEQVNELASELGYSRSQVQLIKDTVAKDTTDEELMLFIHIAKRTGLDPFSRQIYCIKRWDAKIQKEVATPQTSIDGYRVIADRTGRYAPGRETEFQFDKNGNVISATAYVEKWVQGTWKPVSATAYFDEYCQRNKEGKPTAMWARMPKVMTAKCAEALALRRAFPAELSGLYTNEEMQQAENESITNQSWQQKVSEQLPQLDGRVELLAELESLFLLLNEAGDYNRQTNEPLVWNEETKAQFVFRRYETDGGIESLTFNQLQDFVCLLHKRLSEITNKETAQ